MLKKTLPTIILLYILFIVFFIIYMKLYFEAKREADNNVRGYTTVCGKYEEGEVKIGSKNLLVYISDDDCKKTLGLSGKKYLKAEEGMMFIFEKTGNYPFWMKDMNFSIDILWIDSSFKVSGVEKNISPDTYPMFYGSEYKALYVLEINKGYIDKNNIKAGDKINFFRK